jgi:uncharacterized membrane protein YbhN (UPF0104 family)
VKLARAIGFCLVTASVVYFLTAAWRHAGSMPSIAWNTAAAAIFGAVILLYLCQFLLSGIGWHLWLRSVREPSRPMVAIALVALSQIAKYIPGSIAHHVARVALGRRYGLGTAGMVVTIALEQGWAVIAGVALAAASITFIGPALVGVEMPSTLRIMLMLLIALLLPMAGVWLVGDSRPAIMDRWLGPQRIAHPDVATLLACFLIYCANLAIAGWCVHLLARHLFGVPEGHALLAIGVFAAAWVAGVVAMVSPGGIGVREAVMLAGLTPVYGPGAALGVAVTYRIVTSVGDGLGFLMGFFAEKRLARRSAAASGSAAHT